MQDEDPKQKIIRLIRESSSDTSHGPGEPQQPAKAPLHVTRAVADMMDDVPTKAHPALFALLDQCSLSNARLAKLIRKGVIAGQGTKLVRPNKVKFVDLGAGWYFRLHTGVIAIVMAWAFLATRNPLHWEFGALVFALSAVIFAVEKLFFWPQNDAVIVMRDVQKLSLPRN